MFFVKLEDHLFIIPQSLKTNDQRIHGKTSPMSFWILDGPVTLWEPNRAIIFMAIDMLIYP